MSSRPSRGAARLAAILDALPDALLLVNANGTVVNANSIALETFETPGTALVGRGLLDLLPAFDSKRIPGSMRRPDPAEGPRTKPTRMIARRTDGSEFPVEVTSANVEDGRTPYADGYAPYTGDELLMLVVRDLTGTLDTENELARQQRQTEMILRAASEGVVGVDTEGKVVLVNPAAAQILGFRASDLGGQELHPLVHHSRPDGSALPYEETPLADTLRSGRKHRVRGQVLWTKDGRGVPVDLTTAPVREGELLVGAVMTFTDRSRLNALATRHAQLRAVLDASLRPPLEELRRELSGLADDPAGQLWPEANQTLHHLSAGYARMTSLIDNVLAFQRLDAGTDRLERSAVGFDEVISAGVEGAIDLIGPGRAQFAVHAPPIMAMVDGVRLAQAITHLIVDVAGVDVAGRTAVSTGDSTIVVAAAQRGDVVRIDVRGPHNGGSPVHLPITRGIVERHGGVLQTHEVPGGQGGSAYVLEVPIGDVGELEDDADPDADRAGLEGHDPQEHDSGMTVMPVPSDPVRGTRSGTPGTHGGNDGLGRPPRPRRPVDDSAGGMPGMPLPVGGNGVPSAPPGPAGFGSTLALPAGPSANQDVQPTGRRRALHETGPGGDPRPGPATQGGAHGVPGADPRSAQEPGTALGMDSQAGAQVAPNGRRSRRALSDGQQPELPALPSAHALPPGGRSADDRSSGMPGPRPDPGAAPDGWPGEASQPSNGRHTGAHTGQQPGAQSGAYIPGQPQLPSGVRELPPAMASDGQSSAGAPEPTGRRAKRPQAGQPHPGAMPPAVEHSAHAGHAAHSAHTPPGQHDAHEAEARAISVRTLGQGVAFTAQLPPASLAPQLQQQAQHTQHPQPAAHPQQPAHSQQSGASGRRRRLAAPQGPGARQHPAGSQDPGGPANAANPAFHPSDTHGHGQAFTIGAPAEGAEGPEMLDGPGGAIEVIGDGSGVRGRAGAHPGPGGAHPEAGADRRNGMNGVQGFQGVNGVEGVDDEFGGPRRLLVWPEPDVSTRQALTDRGYRPVTVRSREEVDAQVAEYPAALFVDPLTGPITRTALQSLRSAAVAAEVPVLVTAGLGQATREAAYGADPAVLLKALAPRDSDQHPPRVLLVEGHQDIAAAFTATLERRGMQVGHAASEGDAANIAAQIRPNLVVMDLMLIRRRRVGIIDWLRANGLLNRTPLVVYTSVDIDAAELPRLSSGETVLFLAERSTSAEVQGRIVDLLSKIGTEA